MKRFPLILGLCAALLAPGPAAPAARAAPRDVSAEIAARRGVIDLAELILMPQLLELRGYDASEQTIIARGCHYVARNRTDIDSLIDVVAAAKLNAAPAPADGYIGQIMVRLHEDGAREHTIVLDQDYDSASASGAYRVADHAATSTTPIQAETKTERDLRFWASQHRTLAGRCGK